MKMKRITNKQQGISNYQLSVRIKNNIKGKIMYQIIIKIPKYMENSQQVSNANLKQIEMEAIRIMDIPISTCSNDSFDSMTFNNMESNDISMFSSLVSDYEGVTVEVCDVSEVV